MSTAAPRTGHLGQCAASSPSCLMPLVQPAGWPWCALPAPAVACLSDPSCSPSRAGQCAPHCMLPTPHHITLETNCVCIFFPPSVHLMLATLCLTPPQECCSDRTTESAFPPLPEHALQTHHSQRLFSIPEVAEEDGEHCEFSHKQGLGRPLGARTALAGEPGPARPCWGDEAPRGSWFPAKARSLGASPLTKDFVLEDSGCQFSHSATRSPDSGLDCGSEEEELRFSFRSTAAKCSPGPGHCPCRRSLRPLLARRRTLTRQSSIEEDFGEQMDPSNTTIRSDDAHLSPETPTPGKYSQAEPAGHKDFWDIWKKSIKMPHSRASARHVQPPPFFAEGPLVCEVTSPSRPLAKPTPLSFISFCWCPSLGPLLAL